MGCQRATPPAAPACPLRLLARCACLPAAPACPLRLLARCACSPAAPARPLRLLARCACLPAAPACPLRLLARCACSPAAPTPQRSRRCRLHGSTSWACRPLSCRPSSPAAACCCISQRSHAAAAAVPCRHTAPLVQRGCWSAASASLAARCSQARLRAMRMRLWLQSGGAAAPSGLRTFLEPEGSLMRVMPASGLWATTMA
jgi:hypothetical protein